MRPRILIVCEGAVSEPTYFKGLKQEEGVRLVEVRVDDSGGVPRTLVQRAAAMKKDAERDARRAGDPGLAFDEVWCVFDVDEHPKLAEALDQARANGIKVALSNPCFELWVLLHYADQTAPLDRHDAQRNCRSHVDSAAKAVDYLALRDSYPHAVRRAAALDTRQRRNGQPGANPSTWVYLLTERLLTLGREALLLSRGNQRRR